MLMLTSNNLKKDRHAQSIDELKRLPCVQTYHPRSDRYVKTEHHELASLVRDEFVKQGFEIKAERYAVLQGGARVMASLDIDCPTIPAKEMREAAMLARDAFGYDLAGKEIAPDEIQLCANWKHGLDGIWAWRLQAGGKVKVCSNGMSVPFGPALDPVRKMHTTGGIEFGELIETSVKGFKGNAIGLSAIHNRLIEQDCSTAEGDSLIVEAGRTGVLPWARCQETADQWHEPNHPEFEDRNRWSLYNAFTEAIKVRGPALQLRTLNKLPEFLIEDFFPQAEEN